MDIGEKHKEFVQNKVRWYEHIDWDNPFIFIKVCQVPAGALKPLIHFNLFCFGCSHPAPWNSVVFLCVDVEVSFVFVWR